MTMHMSLSSMDYWRISFGTLADLERSSAI